ncbi:MAG TPA: hypothetical protein VGL53_17445 [Bryobacteraceae bacterium]|jgi:hypothetical protein
MIGRREWILIALAASRATAGDAWRKKPSSWSNKDVEAILTKSPWVKVARVEFDVGDIGNGPPKGTSEVAPPPPSGANQSQSASGTRSDPSGNPIGGAPVGRGGIPAIAADLPKFQAVVRWESAAPLRLARKSTDPEAETSHYVISVSGFPMMPRKAEAGDTDADIRNFTLLQRAGKPTLRPEKVERLGGGVLRFTFDATASPITDADREVYFTTGTGSLGTQVKFYPRDMTFEGKLAL